MKYDTPVIHIGRSHAPRSCAVLSFFAMASTIPMALAGDIANCVAQRATFDGHSPIHFATVTTIETASNGAPLYATFPSDCALGHGVICKIATILSLGSYVAIAKACGDWSYAQYIGKTDLFVGWIATKLLVPMHAQAEPSRPDERAQEPNAAIHYNFVLTKGNKTPVCAAYLERLNQTEFRSPPYCDRPESRAIPEFSWLNRIRLSPSQISELSARAAEFENGIPQHSLDAISARNVAQGRAATVPWMPEDEARRHLNVDLDVWRYDPRVDLDNDGTPDDVVVWRGYGPRDGTGICGSTTNNVGDSGLRKIQHAYLLTPGGGSIDSERTASILAGDSYHWNANRTSFESVALGDQIGIFNYRSLYYFDTYLKSTAEAALSYANTHTAALDTLGVFVRHSGVTSEICEYHIRRSSRQ